MKQILLVDDDPHIRDVVAYALQREGFEVTIAKDGAEAFAKLTASNRYDLVVLDIMMPELDGLEVCRRIRVSSQMPIVFVSSRDEELDKILGLELGGDDYITKPFSPRELVARIRAVLRRAEMRSQPHQNQEFLQSGLLRMDLARHEVFWSSTPLQFTITEFGILATLAAKPGRVFSRTQLIDSAYNYENIVTERTVDTHIKRIRKKFRELDQDPIETVHGLGYKLCT